MINEYYISKGEESGCYNYNVKHKVSCFTTLLLNKRYHKNIRNKSFSNIKSDLSVLGKLMY